MAFSQIFVPVMSKLWGSIIQNKPNIKHTSKKWPESTVDPDESNLSEWNNYYIKR